MTLPFFITDVFAEEPYCGNQLATLPQAEGIADAEMQQIAREFNFAETTFIVGGDRQSGFDVRIFTPVTELPFAGHPTLGTAYLIRNEILKQPLEEIRLNLGVGQIPVRFADDGIVWMRQNPPVFGEVVAREKAADLLGLAVSDVDDLHPVQTVSTGLEFLLVPLTSYDALQRARVSDALVPAPVFAFCRGGYDAGQQIQARMFAGELGVSEDPATGSANGCLAAWLTEHAFLGIGRLDVRVGQGYEIGRPSQLYLSAEKSGSEFELNVGGRVNLVAEGHWRVPR